MTIHTYSFRAATPVWEVGTAHTQNHTVCFTADIPATDKPVVVSAAASCAFVLMVNGVYVAHGPARCCHGYFRVDEYDISRYLTKEVNRVALRVASYNRYSYSYLNQPGFLCAEITVGEDIVAATGKDGFKAYSVAERINKVQEYSFQRTFVETYKLSDGAFDYEVNPNTTIPPVEVEPAVAGQFICRDIPYNDVDDHYPLSIIHRGRLEPCERDEHPRDDLECDSNYMVRKWDYADQTDINESPAEIVLPMNTYADLVFDRNTTGIFEFDLETETDGVLFILFAEVLREDHIYLGSLPSTSNVLTVCAKAGKYHVQCAMPHTMKYTRVQATASAMKVSNLHLHHIAYPMTAIRTQFVSDDAVMKHIYDAAVETFRANSVDIYMDCPSRERAGWLCDSFFTSRVERVLTGKSILERAFLQNFLLPESFAYLPKGMLPMCYPSDPPNGVFIPNWAMWYGVELFEYYKRTGDRDFIDGAKARMYGLLEYFKAFENEYGLLEKLEKWVFIEWSHSNDLVQDVSFPSNMLYARLLNDMGLLFDDPSLIEKATAIRKAINELSMTESGFYCDNALRVDGKLVLSGERTESCQYYAFFCDVATPESRPELWNKLVYEFGYDRKEKGLYPEIWPANAFIGNYLRLDLLNRYNFKKELYDNIKGYFTYMADQTGTLWEHDGSGASCNHGFASHVIYWMNELGLLAHDDECS